VLTHGNATGPTVGDGNPQNCSRGVAQCIPQTFAAYHVAVNAEGTLFVTAPTLTSNDAIFAINPHGETRPWFRGLGRPMGLALSKEGDVYLAACLHGRCGLVRVTPQGEATLVLSGPNLVGVAFSPMGTTILATNDSVYDVDLGVEGQNLF